MQTHRIFYSEMWTKFAFLLSLCCTTSFGIIPLKFGWTSSKPVLQKITGKSMKDCEKECRIRGKVCSGLSYNRKILQCLIHGHTKGTDNVEIVAPGMIYSDTSSWNKPPTDDCGEEICGVHMKCTDDNQCIVSGCDLPETKPYTLVRGNMNDVGSKIMYECETGYTAITTSKLRTTSVCKENSTWSTIDLSCSNSHLVYRDMKLLQNNRLENDIHLPFAAYVGTTLTECVRRCNEETTYCIGVNYYDGNNTCEFASGNLEDILEDFTHINITGWVVVAKRLPVFMSFGPSRLWSSMTYEQAISECLRLGTRLATFGEIEAAYSLGYNMCVCGWAADGKAYLSLHYIIPGCFEAATGVSVCGWSNIWNAFCASID